MGTEHVINWRLGVNYNNITVIIGTGIVFRWDGSIAHNLIEMTSHDAVTDCKFVGDNSVALGKVNIIYVVHFIEYIRLKIVLIVCVAIAGSEGVAS